MRFPIGKLLFNLALMACGAALFAALLRLLLPDPQHSHRVEEYSAKTEVLVDEKQNTNLVFIGSSRVNRGVDPIAFDATAATLGWPVHSYNMALGAMNPGEQSRIIEWLFEQSELDIDYLVMEPVFVAQLNWNNITHTRSLYFNDWRGLSAAADFHARSDRNAAFAAYGTFTHTLAYLIGTTGYGSVSGQLYPPTEKSSLALESLIRQRRGFIPTDDDPRLKQAHQAAHQTRQKMVAQMRAKLGELKAINIADVPPLGDAWLDAFLDVAAMAERRGARVVFVFPPVFGAPKRAMQFTRAMQLRGEGHRVLLYTDYAQMPELWDVELWRDPAHFNLAGAKVFSRQLARDVASAYQSLAEAHDAVQ